MFVSGAHHLVDDVTDGGLGGPGGERVLEERQECGVVHVQLVDFVEDCVDDRVARDLLRLERNHVMLQCEKLSITKHMQEHECCNFDRNVHFTLASTRM